MAHGDYECCAVCDSKQGYVGFNDDFKSDICPECRQSSGIPTVTGLLKKINTFTNKTKLKKWLKEIGMSECWYQNDVDDLIAFKLTGKIPEKFNSPQEWLKELGAL